MLVLACPSVYVDICVSVCVPLCDLVCASGCVRVVFVYLRVYICHHGVGLSLGAHVLLCVCLVVCGSMCCL